MSRIRALAAWLAIVALLIDGMLPTAVSAATPEAATPLALCTAAAGAGLPGRHAPSLPIRHCALCAAFFVGLLPDRSAGAITRLIAGAAHPAVIAWTAARPGRARYTATQPRAPPIAV